MSNDILQLTEAADDEPRGKHRWPSYTKLLLTLAVIGAAAYYPIKAISIHVSLTPMPAPPEARGGEPPAPAAATHRLFDEYPDVQADQTAHPVETRAALWVSFRHTPVAERPALLARWRTVAALRPVADGLYRLDCGGPVARGIERVLARYPYAVAPTESADPTVATAYRKASAASPFRVCVVRGDWLFAVIGSCPETATRFGLSASPDDTARYLDEVVPAAAALSPFPIESRGRVPCPPAGITRRALEALGGDGTSTFVRWVAAAELGVPVY